MAYQDRAKAEQELQEHIKKALTDQETAPKQKHVRSTCQAVTGPPMVSFHARSLCAPSRAFSGTSLCAPSRALSGTSLCAPSRALYGTLLCAPSRALSCTRSDHSVLAVLSEHSAVLERDPDRVPGPRRRDRLLQGPHRDPQAAPRWPLFGAGPLCPARASVQDADPSYARRPQSRTRRSLQRRRRRVASWTTWPTRPCVSTKATGS